MLRLVLSSTSSSSTSVLRGLVQRSPYRITYTRKYFEDLNIDYAQIEKDRLAQEEKKLK